jgi:hypothetical protein
MKDTDGRRGAKGTCRSNANERIEDGFDPSLLPGSDIRSVGKEGATTRRREANGGYSFFPMI